MKFALTYYVFATFTLVGLENGIWAQHRHGPAPQKTHLLVVFGRPVWTVFWPTSFCLTARNFCKCHSAKSGMLHRSRGQKGWIWQTWWVSVGMLGSTMQFQCVLWYLINKTPLLLFQMVAWWAGSVEISTVILNSFEGEPHRLQLSSQHHLQLSQGSLTGIRHHAQKRPTWLVEKRPSPPPIKP